MSKYDVVIIGGGLGGLVCGSILSKEGKRVCLLEQHSVIGGCFQSFRRGGRVFDTGMHYLGSMSEGQIMHQYFKYCGVADAINLVKLDEAGYDIFDIEGKAYRHAMGYERFYETLVADFPHEKEGLKRYCEMLKKIGGLISIDILREGKISNGGVEYMGMSAYEFICECVQDPMLRNVLAANNGLYAGIKDRSSLYDHAMINNHYIESAYAFVGGSQHVADAFVDRIQKCGGEVRTRTKVTKIYVEGNSAKWVELEGGERIYADNIISSLHPKHTLAMLENNTIIKKAFFSRINSLENSYGMFSCYLKLKADTIKYLNCNRYLFQTDDVWQLFADYKGCNIPSALFCMQPNANNEYSNAATILIPMLKSEFERWNDTTLGNRGAEYEEFKQRYAETLIDFVCQFIPSLRPHIENYYTATPLTYRDYTSTPDGSAYGIIKDYHNPIANRLAPRTKINNLFLTGQNINVHGCLGTTISAAVTCAELLGVDYLARKIGNA